MREDEMSSCSPVHADGPSRDISENSASSAETNSPKPDDVGEVQVASPRPEVFQALSFTRSIPDVSAAADHKSSPRRTSPRSHSEVVVVDMASGTLGRTVIDLLCKLLDCCHGAFSSSS